MNLKEKSEELRSQRAAEWLQLLREGRRETHAEFVAWIAESPLNLRAFLTADALSRAAGAALRADPSFSHSALPLQEPERIVELVPASARSGAVNTPRSSGLRTRLAWGLAASIVAGIVAVMAFSLLNPFSSVQSYATNDRQQRTIELPDGSLVYLNAGSEISVRLGAAERAIQLTRGEALFDVARDMQRPFRVRTRDATVEAVGTQFNVDARDDGTHVAVVEGKVKISREIANGGRTHVESNDDSAAPLAAGQAARVTRAGQIERDAHLDVRKAIAWSRPELVFEGTSLEDAVAQFNRHRRSVPLRLVGVAPGSHHYTGIFNATDAESFAELLALEPDLSVETLNGEIVIRGR
jgi:transmembrane sensor